MALLNKRLKAHFDKSPPSAPGKACPSVQFLKPKILLLDLAANSTSALCAKGYNVATGTLGTPYHVLKSSGYQPLIGHGETPNHTEQEIVVIDLHHGKCQPSQAVDKHRPDEELDLWSKCDKGFVDPRVRTTLRLRESFDRIHSNGGAFIVFAAAKTGIDVVLARCNATGLYDKTDISQDVWHLLSELSDINVRDDEGTEIRTVSSASPLARAIAPFLTDAQFTCTLEVDLATNGEWETLAINKYGGAVGLARCKGNDGTLIVLPQVKDKTGLLVEPFTSVLPELSPHLFPENPSGKWSYTPEYELPEVLKLAAKKQEVQLRATAEIVALDRSIAQERSCNQWMHDLLTSSDAQLVVAMRAALGKLGFHRILDVDEARDKEARHDVKTSRFTMHLQLWW